MLTILRLIAERPKVRVVADQMSTPTYPPGLASALWAIASAGTAGLHHYIDAGVCSLYNFALAIQEEALAAGLLDAVAPVIQIVTSDCPTPAHCPHFSVPDKTSTFTVLGSPTRHWRTQLRTMIGEIKTNG